MTRNILPLILILTLLTPNLHAAILYVDQQASPTADTFNTISEAVKIAQPGDTIFVASGTYRESVIFPRSGEPGKPITLAALPGQEVIITGADIVTGWEPFANNKRKIHVKRNFDLPSTPGSIFVDGKLHQPIGPKPLYYKMPRGNKTVDFHSPIGQNLQDLHPGSFYFDKETKTIYLWTAQGLACYPKQPEAIKPVIEIPTRGPVVGSTGDIDYITLNNLTIRYGSCDRMWSIVQMRGSNITIENCIIEKSDFGGLGGYGSNWIVRNNIIRDNGATGIGANRIHNGLIQNNDIYNNNTQRFDMFHHAGGIKIVVSQTLHIIGNRIHDNLGPGLWLDIDVIDTHISNNDINNNAGDGIFVEISAAALIRNNRIADNGLRGIYIAASDDCLVEYNQLKNNGILVHGMPRYAHGRKRTLKNNLIRFNTIQNNNGFMASITKTKNEDIVNNRLENNLYISGPVAPFWSYGHDNPITDFAQWVKLTGDTSIVGHDTDRQAPNLPAAEPWSIKRMYQQ